MKKVFKTMAFILLGLVLSMNLMADSYTITFATGSGDGSTASTSTACSTVVSDGSDYLSGNLVTATTVYYSGDYGLKLGSSKNAGTIKMNLSTAGQVTPTSIVVNAKLYNSSKAATLKVNGSATQNLAADFADYTFAITSKITYIELVTSKYAWISSITVNYEGDDPAGPTLESIYFTDAPATNLNYTEGDVFDPAGLVVMGKYSEGDDKDVTEDVEWSFSPATLATTTTSVTVTAHIDDVDDVQKIVNGLTVASAPKFKKVTDAKTDWSGEYLLVYEKDGTAYVWTGVDAGQCHADAAISNNQIAKPAAAATITIASMTGGYSIQVNGGENNGKYINQTKYDNGMTFLDDASANTLAYSEGNVVISGSGNSSGSHVTIRYNSSTGAINERFRYYKSGQQAVQLYEKVLDPISSAVTFTAPTDGSLMIKNGATPINSGTTIQDGTVLDVTFGMTPAEAYKDVAIKVTNTSTSEDVTEKVYDATKKQITMPRYPITVAVTFTKLYKISLVTDGTGTGTATMNGVTTDIYVDGETQIDLVASAVAPNEFTKWSATSNILIHAENDAETYAFASGDGTITATFGVSALQPLDAPTLSAPTNITYNSVTLNWQELANAEGGYNVEILLNDETVAFESSIGETSWTPEVTLQANTTYTYTVQGVGDGTTYAEENNPKATSTFKTDDYPAATLTLSENTVERQWGTGLKLNSKINLPTDAAAEITGKVLMGYITEDFDGERPSVEDLLAPGAEYTMTATEVKLYAVYATQSDGDTYYKKITAAETDWSGKYLIVYETGNLAMDGSLNGGTSGVGKAQTHKTVTENDKVGENIKASFGDQYYMIIEKSGSNYYLKSHFAGENATPYIYRTSNSNGMDASATASTAVGISWDNVIKIAGSTSGDGAKALLRYNKTSGSNGEMFRFYKDGGTSQQAITLYKRVANIDYSAYVTKGTKALGKPSFDPEGGEYNTPQTITLSATEGDIYYTINDGEEKLYEEEIKLENRGQYVISAYAKKGDAQSEPNEQTYTLDWPYTSLAELVAEGAPTTDGRTVTVTLTNEIIESLATSGSYVNGFFTMVGDKKIEVYCKNSPSDWEVGGKVSGTVTCPWKDFQGTWELCPTNWDWVTKYTAPAKITSLVIDGDVTNKNYTAGQKLDFTGLTVTGVYSDATEEDVTADVVWTDVTLTQGQVSATATATLNNVETGNKDVSKSIEITGLTVGAAKTLESIYVDNEHSTHKKAFFVGRPFSAEGLIVMAHYNMGEDQQIALANLTIDNPTFSAAEAEHTINISYTENEVEKNTSYKVAVSYMNLSDLVAATDINDHDHVYVKFENVMITDFYSTKGIYLNVQKGDKDIEIYNPSTNYPNTWAKYGTVSATLDNVEWTYYTTGSVWELKISSWEGFSYAAPNIPVTSMEISPAEVSVGEAKTTTLSIVYDPENATNTGVTWAVAEGSEEFASVDAETGVVTGLKAGTATITATLKADENIIATRTVTVTETAKCEISYYVKGEVASTQQIAREEEGELTYVPTLTVAGYNFAGWAEAAIAEETSTATLISTYTPAAAEATKAVYAVFKRVDDSSPTYQQYAKVTSALTDWAGDYLIAYSDEIFANGQKGGKDDEGAIGKQYVIVNPGEALSGNVVTKEWGDQYKVSLEEISAGSNTYVLKTQDGKYNYQTSNANGLNATSTKSTAAQYPITVTFTSENDVRLALGGSATGAVFRYNTDQFFRYYKDGGQKAVYLYKYDAGTALYTSNPVAKVKVTFNLDGGVGGCGTITVNEGEDAVLCEDAPTKDLYKFKAWSDGENEYAPSATIENVTEDIELTALWIAKQQYTISFNKGGAAGTTPASIKDYEYNEVTLPAQGDLSNPGYIFGGWNDGEITYAGGASFTMPEKNVSMTAVWVAKTNDKWYLVTSAEQLVAGSKYVIANNENDAVAGDITGSYMTKVNATFSDNKQFITGMTGQVELTLGGSTDAWTFAKDASNYLANSGTSLSWSTTASTWKIAFEDGVTTIVEGTNNSLLYNTSSPRFKTYTSSQAAVQLYVLVPAQAINDEVDASTLPEQANVTVNEGGNLLVTEGNIELGDIYVMEGGKVTISGSATLTVSNFVIKSSMGGGQSGQVLGVTSTNLTIEYNAYFDVTLGKNGDSNQWHAFAVPFNVDAINGIYDLDDNKLTNEVNYAIMDYHGDVRAQGQYGWKKFRGIMTPGTFYLMTVDGQRTTYRMKMVGEFSASSSSISVTKYIGAGADTDAGWNGIANSQLEYVSVAVPVQVFDAETYTYKPMTASSTNFTVGTPFFYQANATTEITLDEANGSNPAYAPRMTAEAKNIAVTLGNDNYIDRLYISATDEATDEYQIGRDLVKMTMTNTPAVPQIFAEAYGTKLCMVDAPMMYDEAVYALNLYAPANGEYTIGAAQVEGYEVFLTQYGSVIWNLSMSEATIELTKGNSTEYGLILKATSGHAPTDINTLNGQESVQKFLYNSNIYIRHNNKTFNVQGQLVR